jgi:hypothetical protein
LIYPALIRFILLHSQLVPLYKFSHCGSKKVILSLFIAVKSIQVISGFNLKRMKKKSPDGAVVQKYQKQILKQ